MVKEFDIENVSNAVIEKEKAKTFWGEVNFLPFKYRNTPHHAEAIRTICTITDARNVFEFGCYTGRNLDYFNRVTRNDDGSAFFKRLAGIDINQDAIGWGRSNFNLDIIDGSEESISSIDDNTFDLSFTISVLDHMPDPTEAMRDLIRISSKLVCLLEPSPFSGEKGAVTMTRSIRDEKEKTPAPFTYFHDYEAMISAVGAKLLARIPLPTHPRRVGPYYNLYIVQAVGHPNAMREENYDMDFIRDALIRNVILSLLSNYEDMSNKYSAIRNSLSFKIGAFILRPVKFIASKLR